MPKPMEGSWPAARIEATFVPCQLGVGHEGPASPGSAGSESLPSPSMLISKSDMKSYPGDRFMNAPLATVAMPVSRTATTMSGVLFVIFQTLSALML